MANESFVQLFDGVTAATAQKDEPFSTTGATLGAIQVDDSGGGTFTVVVEGRVAEGADWVTLNVEAQDGTSAASVTATGIYYLYLQGIQAINPKITANSGGTLSVYVGVNS